MSLSRFGFPIALSLAVGGATGAAAQEQHEAMAPRLDLGRLGRVQLENSCMPQVQDRFQEGMALLHSFWWNEAGRAFREVTEADPTCLLGYWGQAMTLKLNPFGGAPPEANLREGQAVLARAAAAPAGTPREREYLDALGAFYLDYQSTNHRSRMLTHEARMRELAQQHPDDREATIFYALAAAANASTTDSTFTRQREIGALLQDMFRQTPDHPGLAHYIIHAYDSPALASLGLDAARQYAEIAPAAFHALHMPSHIFVRLGMWDETIESNLASAAASDRIEEGHDSAGVHAHRLHALDYVVYGYLQLGRDREARGVVKEVTTIDRVAPGEQPLISAYPLAAIPARYALERGDWAAAASLPVRSSPEFRPAEGITHYARGIGAARSGNPAAALDEARAMLALEESLPPALSYWAGLLRAQRLGVEAWVAMAQGDTARATALATEAADLEDTHDKHPVTPGQVLPVRELHGDLLVAMGRPAEARAAYQAVLAREPNRARSLFGDAWAAQLASEHEAAAEAYRQYAVLMEKGDAQRPQLTLARSYAQRVAGQQ